MKKTIAFITDLHLFETLPITADQQGNWEKVLADVQQRKVDQIVIGGDIADAAHYGYFFESLSAFEDRFHVVPGNHDVVARLLHYFPNPENTNSAELFFSFSDENFLYVFLDSSSDAISAPQLHWLREKLDTNHLKVLLFVHHPVFAVDTYVDRKYPLRNREALADILMRQSQEVFIFCGHYHCEDETGTGVVSQYETPAVSYQIAKSTLDLQPHADYFGYRLITLEHANVRHEVIRLQ